MNYRERFDKLKTKYKYWEMQRVESLIQELEESEKEAKNKDQIEANIEALKTIYRNSGHSRSLKKAVTKSMAEMEGLKRIAESSIWKKQEERLVERIESLFNTLEGK